MRKWWRRAIARPYTAIAAIAAIAPIAPAAPLVPVRPASWALLRHRANWHHWRTGTRFVRAGSGPSSVSYVRQPKVFGAQFQRQRADFPFERHVPGSVDEPRVYFDRFSTCHT